ncbi:hypothetical protein SK069_04650 [Patulibacter brassicae]|jgi:hypothetical protein|uniref:C-type cytochrome biogenesis protein CcmI n=1 Tax=Patulibacter brassicae TaxID=1705717 RepID=A0ABU4VIY0_9ACTN|nr:hypothetical protein [Patulibacter brassicae]MDX8150873.1 hypothetical protein [Patulibacter brassicae]
MTAPAAVSFLVVSTALVALGFGALFLLGLLWPGNGSAQLDWKPTRSAEQAAVDEIEDLQQMLNATNERRRRRGAPDLTEASLEQQVVADRIELRRRIEAERRTDA